MPGFASINPFINYDRYVEEKERQKEQERQEKPKPIFPGSQLKCRTCPELCQECIDILNQEKKEKALSGHSIKDSLCWCCEKATVDEECLFMKKRIPVPGWTANKHGDTYHVISCPNFKRGRG